MEQQYTIYMDVCCLNRPFDDWLQPRIRLEAEAVLAITYRCQSGEWQLVSSTALESEIAQTPNSTKRQRVLDSLVLAHTKVLVTKIILSRAKELTALGLKSFDALHVACAESANVDVFLTTDDRLLRHTQSHQSEIAVQVANPVAWLMKVSKLEGDA
ncbi:type II toxin-antitoxin system VapC family toxin [Myxacorys almedinensis]|uniref:PIN domain-containing protein n=1 Tax=Myxacorys almedinensis A TaxID=2690445 RepID=A0A8J7Z4K3_9CYAN|nr:PIN domain-containing protein [Myxacorys almedinensis]NDJ19225.1 PIN domain-containing protein [Myxacorys almedinensis A]